MQSIYKYSIGLVIMVFTLIALSGCSGKSGDEWGIDQSMIPMCSGDINDNSAAILVPPGTVVKSVESGTTIRVWHYANSDEMVCVITGKAVISGGN